MKVQSKLVCDVCKKQIIKFNQLETLQIFKRDSWDCLIDTKVEMELCLKCSAKIKKMLQELK